MKTIEDLPVFCAVRLLAEYIYLHGLCLDRCVHGLCLDRCM